MARAVAVDLLSKEKNGTTAASVYRQLVKLYRCDRVFQEMQSALNDVGGLGTLTGWSCIIADQEYDV